MKSLDHRAIPIALRPLVFMKIDDALHHRTSPAGRGLGAVDNATSIQKAAATEVRCGIKLSPCSFACPSGTIYTFLWPHLCTELRGGTSDGWPLDRVRIFAYQTTPLPGWTRLYVYFRCFQPPFDGGSWLSEELFTSP